MLVRNRIGPDICKESRKNTKSHQTQDLTASKLMAETTGFEPVKGF
jgi:hypothetical protein